MTLRSVKLYGNPLSSYRRFRRDPLAFLQSTDEIGDLVQIPSVTGQPTFVVNPPAFSSGQAGEATPSHSTTHKTVPSGGLRATLH